MIKPVRNRIARTGIILALPVLTGLCLVPALASEKPALLQNERVADEKEFRGDVKQVDVEKKTLKVDDKVLLVAKTTKIMQAGKEIRLEDIKVGDAVHGKLKETADGKLEAVLIQVGPQPLEEPGRPRSS